MKSTFASDITLELLIRIEIEQPILLTTDDPDRNADVAVAATQLIRNKISEALKQASLDYDVAISDTD